MKQITDVKTIKDLLEKYYKQERYTGRGQEYADVVLNSHTKDLAEQGYTIISRHECVLGEAVFFGKKPEWMS